VLKINIFILNINISAGSVCTPRLAFHCGVPADAALLAYDPVHVLAAPPGNNICYSTETVEKEDAGVGRREQVGGEIGIVFILNF
jgi:hypothetical protein